MFSKLFSRDNNKKSIRIKADTENPNEKFISIQLTQSFDYLEFLSLKLSQKDAYRLFDSDYGVIAGRAIGNEGIGLPNCRVSVFIPIDEEDSLASGTRPKTVSEVIKKVGASLYPYNNVSDENNDGIRYNLLPSHKRNRGFNGFPSNIFGIGATPKTPVGSFPDKEEVVVNPSFMHVYEKYYKYTTVTNEAGDFMLFGVPTGNHVLHMDCDLTDIGRWSMSPIMMSNVLGYPDSLFTDEGTKIESSTDLSTLPNIQSHNIPVFVKPLWTQNNGSTEVGITRQDFKVSGDIVPHFNIFANGITQAEDAYIGDRVIFRLVIEGKALLKVDLGKLINICFTIYRPSFRKSEFFKNKPCQMCGGIKDLPPVSIDWSWKPVITCGTSLMDAIAMDVVADFNDKISNKVLAKDVQNQVFSMKNINEEIKVDYKDWMGANIPSGQTFIERINALRVINGLYSLPDTFKLEYPITNGIDRTHDDYPSLIKEICTGQEVDETEFVISSILEAAQEVGSSGYTETSARSFVPKDWTNKFDLSTLRTDTIKAQVFSYKDSSFLTNQMISGLSTSINPEEHIYTLKDGEFVAYTNRSGVYIAQVPCNRTKVITSEDGSIVPSNHPNKGVYSEFAGYFIFSMDGGIENPPSRMRTNRVRIKVPQTNAPYLNTEILNSSWQKEAYIFKSGELYSVAQYIYTLNANYEDRIGFIARPNELGTPMVDITKGNVVSHGIPYNNVFTNKADKANIFTFESDWLNFNLFFLQYMYKTRSKPSNNFVCDKLIQNKIKQLSDNNDIIAGDAKNTKGLLNGAYFKTKIVKLNKTDFINFFTKQDAGFSDNGGVVLETTDKGTYASNSAGAKKTFYKGYFSDTLKVLVDKDFL